MNIKEIPYWISGTLVLGIILSLIFEFIIRTSWEPSGFFWGFWIGALIGTLLDLLLNKKKWPVIIFAIISVVGLLAVYFILSNATM